MIHPTLAQLFILQSVVLLATYVLFFRKSDVPFGLKLILLGTYVTVPGALLIKGIQSAVYVSDLFLPVFLVMAVVSPRGAFGPRRGLVTTLVSVIVVLPLVIAFIHGFVGDQRGGLGSRNLNGDIIWLYRNVTYVVVLWYGMSLRLSERQTISVVQMNVVLAGMLGLMGLVSYLGPVDFAVFEELAWKEWVEEGYQEQRIGLGFMGLFRASVGQWFAMIAILIAGTYGVLSTSYRFWGMVVMGVSIGVILLSQSRAGFVGLVIGLALLSVMARGWVPRAAAIVGVGGMAGWMVFKHEALLSRAESILSGSQNAYDRMLAWKKAYGYFSQHTDAFVFGVGPANRDAVFKAIGAYGAHNEYIDVLFRLGFVGFIGLMGFLFALIMMLVTSRQRVGWAGQTILTTTAIIVIVNCVIGMTQEHLLHDYASHTMGVFIYLFYGIMLGIGPPFEENESTIEESVEASWDAESGYANISGHG
jgi:O-antigen ligase